MLEGVTIEFHNLPEESKSSDSYIKLKESGTFHMMRIYDKDHYAVKDIAYHKEKKINKVKKNILHVHDYERDNFAGRTTRPITKEELRKYRKYLVGVDLNDV